jgi:hypothetical protein
VAGMNESAGKLLNILPNEMKNEITLQSLIPELGSEEVLAQARSNKGYMCSINLTMISQTLGDLDKVYDDSEEKIVKESVWMQLKDHVFGENYNLPCTLRILVFQQIRDTHLFTNEGIEEQERIEVACKVNEQNLTELNTMSMVPSRGSNMSNRNFVAELKASLYKENTPLTVKLFMYVIWSIYLSLLVACIVEWIVTSLKTTKAEDLFCFIANNMRRMNHFIIAIISGRTIDLITRGLEDNSYYGDEFYTKVNQHVIYLLHFIVYNICQFLICSSEFS